LLVAVKKSIYAKKIKEMKSEVQDPAGQFGLLDLTLRIIQLLRWGRRKK
jgi:hypothetical protein